MATCSSCTHRATTTSITGRPLCQDCADGLTAQAAGILDATSQGTDPVAGAIATEGWFRRVRAARKRA